MFPEERKESIIRDAQRGKLWGFPVSLLFVSGAFLFLTLAALLFMLRFSGRHAALSCDHHGLGGCLDIIL